MSLVRLAGALLVAVGSPAAAEELRAERFDLRSLSAEELIAQLKANDDRFDRLRIVCDRTNYSRPHDGHWKRSVHFQLNGVEPPPAPDPRRIDTSLRRYTWVLRGRDVAAEHYALERGVYNPIIRWKLVANRFDEVDGCYDGGSGGRLSWEHSTSERPHRCVTGDNGTVAETKHGLGVGFGHMILSVDSWEPEEDEGRLRATISKWPERTGSLTALLGPELIARELTIELESWRCRVRTDGVYAGPDGLRCAASGAFHGRMKASKRLGQRWDVKVHSIESDPTGEHWEALADHSTPISFPGPRE